MTDMNVIVGYHGGGESRGGGSGRLAGDSNRCREAMKAGVGGGAKLVCLLEDAKLYLDVGVFLDSTVYCSHPTLTGCLCCRPVFVHDEATFNRLSDYARARCNTSPQELTVMKANLIHCESNPLDSKQLWLQLQQGPIHTLMATFLQEWNRRKPLLLTTAVSDCTTETAQDSEQLVLPCTCCIKSSNCRCVGLIHILLIVLTAVSLVNTWYLTFAIICCHTHWQDVPICFADTPRKPCAVCRVHFAERVYQQLLPCFGEHIATLFLLLSACGTCTLTAVMVLLGARALSPACSCQRPCKKP